MSSKIYPNPLYNCILYYVSSVVGNSGFACRKMYRIQLDKQVFKRFRTRSHRLCSRFDFVFDHVVFSSEVQIETKLWKPPSQSLWSLVVDFGFVYIFVQIPRSYYIYTMNQVPFGKFRHYGKLTWRVMSNFFVGEYILEYFLKIQACYNRGNYVITNSKSFSFLIHKDLKVCFTRNSSLGL